MDSKPALIAGGGIAGLAVALGLARHGRPSRVFEQQAALTEVGAGLQMSPNGVRALQHLGAWEAVEPACVAPREIQIRDGKIGAMLQRVTLGGEFERQFGAPYRVVHRGDLLAGLAVACQKNALIDISLGKRAASGSAGQIKLESGETADGGLVIACDGIRSTLRQQAWPGTAPRYRGHALYRALIPAARVPPAIAQDCVTLWLMPGGHVVHYAVSGGRNFNIVAAIDSGWSSAQWSEPGDRADLALFDTAHGDLADLLDAPEQWLRWAGADLPPLSEWTKPGFTLAGDAAHATLPYLAQGAVMSLEDACVLGHYLAVSPDEQTALHRYEAERRPRCTRIQDTSHSLAGIYHARGLKAIGRNAALRLISAEAFINRNAWIYSWRPPE